MTKSQQFVSLVLLCGFVVLMAAMFMIHPWQQSSYSAGAGTFVQFTATNTTNTSVACGNGVATQFLEAASGRNYAAWTVESSTAVTFFFSATSTNLVQGGGLVLNGSGGNYELKAENLYVGRIYCMGNGATSTVGLIYNQ